MFNAATTALLRAVHAEVCEDVSRTEIGIRTHAVAKILKAARRGDSSTDKLRQVGHQAIAEAVSSLSP
ncbi:hypothetical protein ACVIIW_003914 [Bradyrhizobium sp. USDA 4449]